MKKTALALALALSVSFVGCNNSTTPKPEPIEKHLTSSIVKKLEGVRKGYGKIVKAALKSSEMEKVAKVVDSSNKYQEKLTDTIDTIKSGKLNKEGIVKKLEGVRKGYGKIVKAALKFDDMNVVQNVVDTSNKYQEKLTDTIDLIKK